MKSIIIDLHSELLGLSDEEWKKSSQRYFKESVEFIGVKGKEVQRLDREYYSNIKDRGKEFVFSLCEELWQSPYFEENIIACNWAYNQKRAFLPEDIALFERWLDKYVTNWATCDTLCNHTDYSCPQRALPGRNFRNCFYSPSRPRRHGTEGIRVDA